MGINYYQVPDPDPDSVDTSSVWPWLETSLDEQWVEVLRMRYVYQMPQDSIAKAYKITRAGVVARRGKALRLLRHPSRIRILIQQYIGWHDLESHY